MPYAGAELEPMTLSYWSSCVEHKTALLAEDASISLGSLSNYTVNSPLVKVKYLSIWLNIHKHQLVLFTCVA